MADDGSNLCRIRPSDAFKWECSWVAADAEREVLAIAIFLYFVGKQVDTNWIYTCIIYLYNFSPVCRPWQVPPGAARTPAHPCSATADESHNSFVSPTSRIRRVD